MHLRCCWPRILSLLHRAFNAVNCNVASTMLIYLLTEDGPRARKVFETVLFIIESSKPLGRYVTLAVTAFPRYAGKFPVARMQC